MPSTKQPTPGDYIAKELIAAKTAGQSFLQASLSSFIDVRLEHWLQANGFYLQAGEPITAATPEAKVSPAEAIYAAYPRKVGKMAALKAIQKAISAHAIAGMGHVTGKAAGEAILKATVAYAAAVATWPARDRAYIPHASTWFNRGSYLDDPKEWQRGHSAVTNTTARDYSKV